MLKSYANLKDAEDLFHTLYRRKTWNNFLVDKCYHKKLNRYFQVPGSSKSMKTPYRLVPSRKLHGSVQNLLGLLMNQDIMKGVMVKFNLDMNKMPLGKVRGVQIKGAALVLNEIYYKILGEESRESLVEASNRFYSIIPHKACSAYTLVTLEDVIAKHKMLHDLNGIRFAYKFQYKTGESGKNILDDFYSKLNTQIEPLDEKSEQFRIIKDAVNGTKDDYKLDITQIFTIQRCDEADQSEMFDGLTNHRLLWHGSRITNINLILANGLKIAPPEITTATACALGKGLYFSDVIANSMEYCYAQQSNNIGVVLLYEVALGNSIQHTDPEMIDELPVGKHSVHGVGRICAQSIQCIDNAIISCGPLHTDNNIDSFFNYDEFVVYKNTQIKLKYLVQFKLNDAQRRFQFGL